MNNKGSLIIWGIVFAAGVGLIIYSLFSNQDQQPDAILTTSPQISLSPGLNTTPSGASATVSPALSPNDDLAPSTGSGQVLAPQGEYFVGLNGITAPANCQLSGNAVFSDFQLYSSDTKLLWKNVDTGGRLIKWRVIPDDGLVIGPNIFANLTIPDGEYENITIKLPESPITKNYTLKASVTYGQFINENVEVKETSCEGQIEVNINF